MMRPAFRALSRPALTSTRALRQPQTSLHTLQTVFLRQSQLSRSKAQNQAQSAIRQYATARAKSPGSPWNAMKILFRAYPYSVSLAVAIILFGSGVLLYSNYIYHTYIVGAFHKFPEPVAKELRKALFYTNQDLRPHDALKYYKKALRISEEIGMDPFSDEILGVKIQMAAFFEKIEQREKAIQVLEIVKRDCLTWMEELGIKAENISSGKRTRVLAKTVQISTKLGELYASPYVMRKDEAEKNLIWAVETALRESIRRQNEGVKEGEGEWMDREAIGMTMENLAGTYEEKDDHELAAPLYLQAINLSPLKKCHTATLMNNLSISLAQQTPTSRTHTGLTPSRAVLVENARQWANKAIEIATTITPAEGRDEECDVACAVATHNLAEFAEMNGDIKEARVKYSEAKYLAKALGFDEGVKNAEGGLGRVGEP